MLRHSVYSVVHQAGCLIPCIEVMYGLKQWKLPIYLPITPQPRRWTACCRKMMRFLTMDGTFGNPASPFHRFGWQAEEAVDIAHNQIAELVGADPRNRLYLWCD